MTLLPYAIDFALVCFGAAILMNLWLVARGPGMLDRVLALDTMAINVIALITLWGIRTASAISFEAALLFATTGFVGTVAYAKFVLRGDVIE
jgi:multicomponent K+:H+ antiporter subunit F